MKRSKLGVCGVLVVALTITCGAYAKDEAPAKKVDPETKITAALAKLTEADRKLAESQRYCPAMAGSRLGSMGKPVKLMISGKIVFLCCAGCDEAANANPAETLKQVELLKKVAVAMAKLSPEDRRLAEEQRECPIQKDSLLGSMGKPVKIMIASQPVFLCCAACKEAALAEADATLAKVKDLKTKK